MTSQQIFTQQAMSAEMLDADTERELAYAWQESRDERALKRLVTAYTRLAVAMAAKFKRYGLPMDDLIQEACLGLMKAADRFDPTRKVRFSTYAIWWVKAALQEAVMRNHSSVRIGSTSAQKSLFFNLRRVRAELEREAFTTGEELDSITLRQRIAEEVGVSIRDVELMESRLAGPDFSLHVEQAEDGGRLWIDTIEDEGPLTDEVVTNGRDLITLSGWLAEALEGLNPRERRIIHERKLKEEPRTLESLGQEFDLSKERIRQIEAAALRKLRKLLSGRRAEIEAHFA